MLQSIIPSNKTITLKGGKMKRGWLILIALFVITAVFANSVTLAPRRNVVTTQTRYEVVAWEEDFEDGATGWTHWDGAESPNNWHVYNNGDAQGNVWWMGDPSLAQGANIGGYHDHQYLVLDTPARTITAANTNLTFKMRHNLEDPAGATAPYNGWDSANVRISTDGGNTWTPITGTPAYDFTSSYAFGFEHGEGPNIPAWGGVRTAWTNCSFNLSAYVGQNVKIRFAFASDPAYSTGDAPAMYGIMIDDIAFADYTNNGVDDGQMTWTSLVPLGGDLWHLAVEASAPSPTHVMKNQNAQGSYNPNMLNYLMSPPIQLPSSGDIRVDFMIKGNFTDPNTFPEVDYHGWEISPNNGVTWFAMSNPYGIAGQPNYVYSDAPPEWTSMCESYSLDGFISDYAGETILLRWYFKSDADAPQGTGIMIDDVKIYNDIFIAEPENLTAEVTGSSVLLNWTEPGGGGGGEEGWLHHDTGTNGSSIGLNDPGDWYVSAKYAPDGSYTIAPWVGMQVTKIKFFPAVATANYTVKIWTGPTGATEVASQVVTNPVIGQWNEVILNTPITIQFATYYWFGYQITQTVGGTYPAGCDGGPAISGWGDMIRTTGSWSSLYAGNPALNYNWNIQAYVADAAGREYNISRNRDVTAYKIYRDEVYITEVPGSITHYTDTDVSGGLHTYYITAMYGTNESNPSNIATVFITPAGYVEMMQDDGTAESGYSVGSTRQMAVKYSHTDPVYVRYAKVYVHTVNTAGIIIRIWDTSGPNGMPGSQSLAQFQYPASSVVQGWNYVTLPDAILIPSGEFYIGILETTNACLIGLDNSSNGFSYKRITADPGWEPVTEGELMIRAIVETTTSSDDPTIPALSLRASNFPNPFNPVTTISYAVPATGDVSIKVYNMKGQVVRTLVNSSVTAGNHSVVWNGTDDNGSAVSSGLYFYKIQSNNQTLTKKMLLAK